MAVLAAARGIRGNARHSCIERSVGV